MSSMKMGTHDSGLPFVDDNGEQRILAALPMDRRRRSYKSMTPWSAEMPVIPRSQWKETPEDEFGCRVLDQNGQGSCVGHAAATGFEMAWLRAGGQPVAFSACFIYGLINGGRDNGAIVSDAGEVLETVGVCTEAEVPPRMIYSRQFPAKAKEVASLYKLFKRYAITTFDELCTAIQMGWTVNSGVMVGGNYADLDSDGIAPLPRGGGGGHARMQYALKNIRGNWYPKTWNSWGTRYGMNGKCYEQERMYGRNIDAYAIKAIVPDSMKNLPPVAKA